MGHEPIEPCLMHLYEPSEKILARDEHLFPSEHEAEHSASPKTPWTWQKGFPFMKTSLGLFELQARQTISLVLDFFRDPWIKMPYSIRKLPGKKLYRVRKVSDGKVLAKATTLKKAKAQIRLLYMLNRTRMESSRRSRGA
jgi:hypothetical protein